MTIPSDTVGQPSVRAGRATWRVAVASEADRLEAQLDDAIAAAVLEGDRSAAGPAAAGTAVAVARSAVARARAIATGRAEHRLRDWWYGTSIESAWQALHLASEQMVMAQPDADLRARAPHLAAMARSSFAPDRAAAEAAQVGSWTSAGAGRPDPRVAQRILNAHHDRSNARHQQIRGLRNLLYIVLAVVVAIDCALWATGVTTGTIVGLGALAGALSVVFALRAGTPPGPYNVLPPQSLLKIASGAATALMAVKILDYVSGASASILRDSMYAVIFGFAQQAFTRLVDQQAGALAHGPNARTGTASPALPSWSTTATGPPGDPGSL
jgi:hypothetical protein